MTALYRDIAALFAGGADVATTGDSAHDPSWVPPLIPQRVRDALQQTETPAIAAGETFDEILTARETAILKMVVEGKANKEISRALVLAEGTVKNHVSDILSKLHVRSRTELTAKVLNRPR